MKRILITACVLSLMAIGAMAQKVGNGKMTNVMASPYRGTPGEVRVGFYVDNANCVLLQRVPVDTITPKVHQYLGYDTACKCWKPDTGVGATGATGPTGATGATGGTVGLADTSFVPATTDTVQLLKNGYNIISPAGTIALVVFKLPSSPADRDVVEVKVERPVTSLHYYNGTVVTGVDTTAVQGTYFKKQFRAIDSKWH